MKALVSLSGGMDSATVLAEALREKRDVSCVGFTYGSKHNRWENEAAARLASHYNMPFTLVDLSGVMKGFKSDLLLLGGEIPEGHYEEKSMERTVVPARNMIFISVLAGLAVSQGAKEIWLGVHAGDHAIYPDCRPEFVRAMLEAVRLGTGDSELTLRAPFLHTKKGGILKVGLAAGVPFQWTRTCYQAQEIACGRCGSCQERLEAFRLNGVEDPLPYESREELARV